MPRPALGETMVGTPIPLPAQLAGNHCEDPDADGVFDITDNCPDTPNLGQDNNVHPLTPAGDHCEDPEPDLVPDIDDNCSDDWNPGQAEGDGDGVGDAYDHCPSTAATSSGLTSAGTAQLTLATSG